MLTVATFVLLLAHVTALFAALPGSTVAVSCVVSPIFVNVAFVLSNDTFVTGTFTVTVQLAVFPPDAVVTVIVALPLLAALTTPLPSTVATEGLLLVQVTDLFVALPGSTIAVSCSV